MRKSCEEMKQPKAKLDPGAVQALGEYEWPGNVRELENRIKRAVVMGEGQIIRAVDLDLHCGDHDDIKRQTLKDIRESTERDFIYSALVENNGNIARTAEQIGITRPTLYDLIKKYNLQQKH